MPTSLKPQDVRTGMKVRLDIKGTEHPYLFKYVVLGVSPKGIYVRDRFGDVQYFLFVDKEFFVDSE